MAIRSGIKYFFLAFLLVAVVYLFWGPMFPWSPLKIGFTKIKSSKATVYITDLDNDSAAFHIDEICREEELFHKLEFRERFRIIILGKESNMKRFLPWMRGKGYSVKLGFANVIYIGSNARKSEYGIKAFLKHEISHLLIHQNTASVKNNFEILKQGWLSEGVATYFGGPHYYKKKEFVELWMAQGMKFDRLYEDNPLRMKSIFSLKYTYYRFFIEYLIDSYGLEKFQAYLNSYVKNPINYKLVFPVVYNEELPDILRKFSIYMTQ